MSAIIHISFFIYKLLFAFGAFGAFGAAYGKACLGNIKERLKATGGGKPCIPQVTESLKVKAHGGVILAKLLLALAYKGLVLGPNGSVAVTLGLDGGVKLFTAVNGQKLYVGVLNGYSEEEKTITVDDVIIPLDKAARINLHFDFED